MSGRVLFYVQHLLGVGHLKRASLLARAMAAAGLDVSVVLGGPEVPDVGFDGCSRFPLPPVRAADETFAVLVDERGNPIDDAWKDGRMARLMAVFDVVQPDVLLVEQFPFGRRQFRFAMSWCGSGIRSGSARWWLWPKRGSIGSWCTATPRSFPWTRRSRKPAKLPTSSLTPGT
jgi:hypothetical protein